MMMESGAKPCVVCGTEGGACYPPHINPPRPRGRCLRCYFADYRAGEFDGYRPLDAFRGDQPSPWPHLDDVQATGHMLWHDKDGERHPHAVMPWCAGEVRPVLDLAIERSAARWLRDHPDQLVHWEHPELSLFGTAPATTSDQTARHRAA